MERSEDWPPLILASKPLYNFRTLTPTERMTCTMCNTKKKMNDIWRFGRSYATCKQCRKIKHSAKAKSSKIRKFGHKREFVDWLKSSPCVDCRRSFHPVAMDFDHRDPSKKVNGISYLTGNHTTDEALWEEILKCDLVCSNCHRLRTFQIDR